MKFVNLTNNAIRVFDASGKRMLFEVPTDPRIISEAKVRPETVTEIIEDDTGRLVPVIRHRYTLIDELPEPENGVVYVVGWATIQALEELGETREDLIAPDTSRESAVRGSNNRIVGVRQFRVL